MTVWRLYCMCNNLAPRTFAALEDENFITIWQGAFEDMPEKYRRMEVDEFVFHDAGRSTDTEEVTIFILPE